MKRPEERNEKDMAILGPELKQMDFFKTLKIEGQDIHQVCQELQYEYLHKGEAVFKYGEYGNKFYVILKGEVAVKIPDPKAKKT